jgi:ferrochelatase
MYPQYSATTTAAVLDGVWAALRTRRVVPPLRVVPPYYQHPAYLGAAAERIAEALAAFPEPDRLLISFHGIPRSYVARGDPYPEQCRATFEGLCERTALPREKIMLGYQSRFGPQPWLEPYTDQTLGELGRAEWGKVLVAAPGFTADCLETLEELGMAGERIFRAAGGGEYCIVPCLNDHPAWIEAMKTIVLEESAGWITP